MTTGPNGWLVDRIESAARTGSALLPLHARFGIHAVGARAGQAVFGHRMGPWLLDRHGRLCPGAFLVAADAALGSAVATALTTNRTIMTLTLRADFVRLRPGAASAFVVRGDATHLGDGSGFAAGDIVDDAGRLFARISAQCGYTSVSAEEVPAGAPAHWTGYDLDPSLLGVGSIGGGTSGELAPIAVAGAGARVLGAGDDGRLHLGATSVPEIRNSRGDVQGGVLGLLAEQALTASLLRARPTLNRADNLELTLTYLRPLGPDRPELRLVSAVEHAGRRFGLAHARGIDSAGRLVVSAYGSSFAG